MARRVQLVDSATLRNSAEAYRQFFRPDFLSRVNEAITASMRHKVTSGLLGLIAVLGFIGWSLTFWS